MLPSAMFGGIEGEAMSHASAMILEPSYASLDLSNSTAFLEKSYAYNFKSSFSFAASMGNAVLPAPAPTSRI